jgi:hypothetical protein
MTTNIRGVESGRCHFDETRTLGHSVKEGALAAMRVALAIIAVCGVFTMPVALAGWAVAIGMGHSISFTAVGISAAKLVAGLLVGSGALGAIGGALTHNSRPHDYIILEYADS